MSFCFCPSIIQKKKKKKKKKIEKALVCTANYLTNRGISDGKHFQLNRSLALLCWLVNVFETIRYKRDYLYRDTAIFKFCSVGYHLETFFHQRLFTFKISLESSLGARVVVRAADCFASVRFVTVNLHVSVFIGISVV